MSGGRFLSPSVESDQLKQWLDESQANSVKTQPNPPCPSQSATMPTEAIPWTAGPNRGHRVVPFLQCGLPAVDQALTRLYCG